MTVSIRVLRSLRATSDQSVSVTRNVMWGEAHPQQRDSARRVASAASEPLKRSA